MATALTHRTVGDGPPLLLIHGAAEDADLLEPQARAFAAHGRRVIWYDRRGTGRTPRDGWPESGVAGHADDAAEIITGLDGPVQVIGYSSGGVVALALAARHPELDLDVIAWEPAAVGCLPNGAALHAEIMAPIEAYLTDHPGDWAGAFRTMIMIISDGQADLDSAAVAAQLRNAEAAVRDDARMITPHAFSAGELPSDRVRLARGNAASDLHLAVLTALEQTHELDTVVIDTADDHEAYLWSPEVLAAADWSRR
jgi:pimeloyl-ACP methyl ester carboxylesterase